MTKPTNHADATNGTGARKVIETDMLAVLKRIVAAWESIPENDQVPEQINVDELWDEARKVIELAQGR